MQAVIRGHRYDVEPDVRPAPPGDTFSIRDVLSDEEVALLANWPIKPEAEDPHLDALTFPSEG